MPFKKLVPACANYIKSTNQSNIIYTLSLQYIRHKQLKTTKEELFHLLQAANIFSKEHLQPDEIEGISCFTVISDYKCSFICHLCPLSSHYKNHKEETENMILAYALKSWKNYQFLIDNGLNSKVLQSLFLINPNPTGSIVATLPLMRLAFAYIENAVKPDTQFSTLPNTITQALEQNNRGKLTSANTQVIRTHLTNLYKNYLGIEENTILELMADILNKEIHPPLNPPNNDIDKGAQNDTAEKQSIVLQETTSSPSAPCLEGLLGNSGNSTNKTNNKNQASSSKDNKTGSDSPKIKQPLPQTPLMHFSSAKQSQLNSETETFFPDESESLFLSPTFSLADYESTGYPIIQIRGSSTSDLHQFEAFLLYNPTLAVEITNDKESGQEYLLFCASKLFYYAAADDENIISLIGIYFSKSSARHQICLDPYRLYHFLHKNKLYYKNVFSLRTAHKVLATAQNRNGVKTPSELVKELCSKKNSYNLPIYTFLMLHYSDMFSVICNSKKFQEKEQQKAFDLASTIDTLLGISYELKDIVETDSSLFTLDSNLEINFKYNNKWRMKIGYYSVNFTLSADKPINGLVINILYRFAMKNLSSKFGYRLLSFTHTSFTIATTEKYYAHLCEAIANLVTYLAEKENILPIIIKENILNQ